MEMSHFLAPSSGFNNNEQISNCLSSYYNSKGGKILEFGSLLSMVPGWDPEPGKNILENIFLMGGKLIGLKGLQTVGQAGIQSAVSGTATSIASPLENLVSSGAGKALGAVGATKTGDRQDVHHHYVTVFITKTARPVPPGFQLFSGLLSVRSSPV